MTTIIKVMSQFNPYVNLRSVIKDCAFFTSLVDALIIIIIGASIISAKEKATP